MRFIGNEYIHAGVSLLKAKKNFPLFIFLYFVGYCSIVALLDGLFTKSSFGVSLYSLLIIIASLVIEFGLAFWCAFAIMRKACRALGILVLLFFFVLLSAQITTMLYSRDWLTADIIFNVSFINYLPVIVYVIFVIVLIPAFFITFSIWFKSHNSANFNFKYFHGKIFWIIIPIFLVSCAISIKFVAREIIAKGTKAFPVYMAIRIGAKPNNLFYISWIRRNFMNRCELPEKSFRRDVFYKTQSLAGTKDKKSAYNIIIFFFEGVSARLLECYGGKYPGLTPNFNRFVTCGTVVDGYYNHTAATLCALPGQDASYYPWDARGAQYFHPRGLFTILGEMGYQTDFLYSENSELLTKIMHNMGVQNLYDASRIQRMLSPVSEINSETQDGYSISDAELFRGVIARLKTKEFQNQPFYMSIYNLETHAFRTSPHDSNYDGKHNPVLDSLHNLDRQFGRFWDYFIQSELKSNTIVILTADHAHFYGNPPYAEIMKEEPDFKPYFCDRIPLLIYHPTAKLPKRMNVQNRTSLDLAPSVFHLLGIQAGKNYFLGHSIFEDMSERSGHILDGGVCGRHFVLKKGQIFPSTHDEETEHEVQRFRAKLHSYCYYLYEGLLDH